MKTKLLILFLIIITSILSTTVQQVGAFDMQAWMEKVYLQHQSKKFLKDQVKSSDKGIDLHTSSLAVARQETTVALHESIEQIINTSRFNNPSCALTYDDAAVLLIQNKQFKRLLSWIRDFNPDFSYAFDDSNFVASCARYLYCTTGVKKKSSSLSANEYQVCITDPSNQFNKAINDVLQHNLKGSYSYGNEIFENGTLEDSSFDIVYDIEQINKILFANPKRLPNTYLRGPPNYLSKIQLIPTKLYAGNASLPGVEDAIKQIVSSQKNDGSNPDSNIVSNLQCFDPTPIITSDSVKEFKKQIATMQKAILTLKEEKLIDDAIGVISQPFADEPPQPSPGDPLPPEITNPIQDNQTADDRGGPGGGGNNGGSTPPNTGTQCPTKISDISEQFNLKSDKPNIKECLATCQSCPAGALSKAACYSQCLCTKFSQEFVGDLGGTSFGIKLCLVPSTTPDIITPGTQVVSIQEIVNQISAIISKLKSSGQYIPSSKPSEFFSPTVKIGKLSNLLNFAVNVTWRSKYHAPDKKTKTEETVQYFKNQIPNIPQLHIQGILSQQDMINDFLKVHLDFWTTMNTIFKDRDEAMKQFKETQQ